MQFITGTKPAVSAETSTTDYFPTETYRKLGTDASRAISLVNKLKTAGAEYDLELPRIVFAGKQSAGKSSIVKALTSVQLPRNYGTCTRCPIEVTTKNTPGESWQCRISLRITTNDDTQELYSPPIIEESSVLTSCSTMPEEIERAQKSLLDRVTNGTNFTRNVICVNISGKDCPDLSLVDLPGLIQSTESKDDESDIECVETLVREYLSSVKTVILQCISCDEDMENQSIRKLARDVDPRGSRSIGVLTKPDKVDLGTEDHILAILNGEKYELAQGYFVVRTPKQDELNKIRQSSVNITAFEEARAIENAFFQYHEVGRQFFEQVPELCGSKHLLDKLSSMLQGMINDHIPEMQEKLEAVLAETQRELKELGVETDEGDARMELIEIARRIANNSTEAIKSTTRDKSFWRRTVEIFEDVNQSVCDTSPMFQIGDRVVFSSLLNLDVRSNGFLRDSLKMNVCPDEFTAICTEAQSSELILSPVQAAGGISWQIQVGKESGCLSVRVSAVRVPQDIDSVSISLQLSARGLTLEKGQFNRMDAKLIAGCPSQPILFSWPHNSDSFFIEVSIKIQSYAASEDTDRVYDISEVKEMLENTSGRDFPGIRRSSSAVCQELIGETVELWKDPAFLCSKSVHNLLRYHLLGDSQRSAINQFVSLRFKKLKRAVFGIISKHLDSLEKDSMQHMSKLIGMERPPFFTLDDYFLSSSRSKFFEVIEALDANKTCDDEVTEVIVSTMSFIRIKQKLFAENVVQYLLHHCLGNFEDECEKVLLDGMGLTGGNRKTDGELHRLFDEEDDVFVRRKELKERQDRQKTALDLIATHLAEYRY